MASKQLDQLIQEMETYCECWKQFHHFVNLAREKKFGPEEEAQFLEVKTIIVQQLELILASVEVTAPTKEEVHNVLNLAPSLRYLSELNDAALRGIENQWHKIYIGLHAILGQLKVKQRQEEGRSFLSFRKNKES